MPPEVVKKVVKLVVGQPVEVGHGNTVVTKTEEGYKVKEPTGWGGDGVRVKVFERSPIFGTDTRNKDGSVTRTVTVFETAD